MTVKELVQTLAERELENRRGTGYASAKEAWAWIKQGIDNAGDSLKAVNKCHAEMWEFASDEDQEGTEAHCNIIIDRAILAAEALIRTAAAAYLYRHYDELSADRAERISNKVTELAEKVHKEDEEGGDAE